MSLEFFFDIKSFRSHYDHGVDSISNINGHQEYFLWGKGGRCVRSTTYQHIVPLSRNLGTLTFWNPLGHPPLPRSCNGTVLPSLVNTHPVYRKLLFFQCEDHAKAEHMKGNVVRLSVGWNGHKVEYYGEHWYELC